MLPRPQKRPLGLAPFVFLALCPVMAHARPEVHELTEVPPSGTRSFDRPPASVSLLQSRAVGDTISFGNVGPDGFAIEGGIWTFDNGNADPLEGWYATDVTAQTGSYWRHISDADWDSDPNHTVSAPVLRGTGSAWCGAVGAVANELCWDGGVGYGNRWCQRLSSPMYSVGSGNVALSWTHFNDSEEDYDYTYVYLKTLPSGELTELRRYADEIGLAPNHPNSPPTGADDSESLAPADFGSDTEFRIIFEFTSDGAWSDEDGLFVTAYGPCAFDDVDINGQVWSFEDPAEIGPGGWSAEVCPGIGAFMDLASVGTYLTEDACDCRLAGNVLEFHDDSLEHPKGQRVMARSAPVDLLAASQPAGEGERVVLARWSQYSELPQRAATYYRPGWEYYPWTCPITGVETWSGRVGQNTFFFVGNDPECRDYVNLGADTDVPVPPDAEQVRFIFEVYSSCDAFTITDDICNDITNFTPLIDNIEILTTLRPDAPPIAFDNGLMFQDGFSQGTLWNRVDLPGNADVTRNVNFGATPPIVLGDSLYVSGPLTGPEPETQWEAKLWFQVETVGPGADHRYFTWRDKVSDGNDIENGDWAFAFMDSFETGTVGANNKFVSYFREDDDDFDGAQSDLSEAQEIIEDGVLFPGTQVNYFLSSNYIGNPQSFTLPDTTGGFSLEFSILPMWRDDNGTVKHPGLLYIDAENLGAQYFIEKGLDAGGFLYDRYDYLDAQSNWKAPMARGSSGNSNNGCTLGQLLDYRGILVNSGASEATTTMWPLDYLLFDDWLTAEFLCGETSRQGLIVNGNGIAGSLAVSGASLLSGRLQASLVSENYAEFSGDENDCVRIEAPSAGGEAFGTSHSVSDYEYDVFGNWCPRSFGFDVLGAVGSGVGNRVFLNTGDLQTETAYAQVASENLSSDNYRTLIDGTSWHLLSEVDPVSECVSDSAHIVTAVQNELRAALEWIYGVDEVPELIEECPIPSGVDDWGTFAIGTTRMFSSRPNPYNRRTTLRFVLAQSGPVGVAIFDSGGRRVRQLVDGPFDAGRHELHWDGTDDDGRRLPSGVYWARVNDGRAESSAKLVQLQ